MRPSHFGSQLGSLFGIAFLLLLAGCATTAPQKPRPFFVAQMDTETHGRKTWFDRVIETDPGGVVFEVASDYQERPPQRIAVLPFVDLGNGDYVVNKIPVLDRSEEERDQWSWTHANRLRHAVIGALATREFVIVPPLAVDAVLADRGVTDRDKLLAVPPAQLGRWLDVDTVVYGELRNYEAYYAFLVAGWEISSSITMVSTLDERMIFSCADHRYSITISPALDPIDIAINSMLNLLMFRDVALARTEYEVGREIVLRLPPAERNIAEFRQAVRRREDSMSGRPIPPPQSAWPETAPMEQPISIPLAAPEL